MIGRYQNVHNQKYQIVDEKTGPVIKKNLNIKNSHAPFSKDIIEKSIIHGRSQCIYRLINLRSSSL